MSIAYRVGWKQAQILHNRSSPLPLDDVEGYVREQFSSLFNEGELQECIQGFNEAIPFLYNKQKEKEDEQRERERILDRLDEIKNKRQKRAGLLWFLLALHMDDHFHDSN